jgi:hypothetical protein
MNENMAEDVLELLDNVSQTWEGIQPKNEPVIYASQFFTNLSQLASFRWYMAGKETALNNSNHSETISNSGGQSADHSQEYLPTVWTLISENQSTGCLTTTCPESKILDWGA